ncbi:unnamed protein product [Phytophthora fragariaefolia]|uniref:Unnamed protein product n=1 Tax=Phytophthora fragariaefolia TaxID=1490495 RepID=A0A9W6X0K1_9STRA|nr:unnamed protein product [Phytophthora fragariaefolia]
MTKRTTVMASAKAQKEQESSREDDVDKQHEAQELVYCGEGCYNRMLFISCSDETCSAPDPSMCSNRAIKRREIKSVRVEYIPGPGFGLIANDNINAGEFIIEYVGEVIDDIECERRMIQYRDNGEVVWMTHCAVFSFLWVRADTSWLLLLGEFLHDGAGEKHCDRCQVSQQ